MVDYPEIYRRIRLLEEARTLPRADSFIQNRIVRCPSGEAAALRRVCLAYGVKRDEEDDPEGIRPQTPLAVRPDALSTHPGELVEDIARVVGRRAMVRLRGRKDRYPEGP